MQSKLQVHSPYDHHWVGEIVLSDTNDLERKLSVAHHLFLNRSEWIPKHERKAILERVVHIMSEQSEVLTLLAAEEGGKPYMDSRVEVERAINGVKLAIENIGQLSGEEIPMGLTNASVNRLAFTIRDPIGVVVSISAFNHPLNLAVHQTVPAIAAGCPVIIKPALTTPLSCFRFVEILQQAGLPKEWCQAVVCDDTLAEKLATDKRVKYLSFIGSAKVGWHLRSKLAPGTACALEHGGAAPVIIEPDADIDAALPLLAKGAFYHAGQVCVSVQRIFVHQSFCNQVADSLSLLAEKLVVGNPLEKTTEVGPLILTKDVDRVGEWVEEAKLRGGKVLCGGKKLFDNCYSPTVILNPSDNAKVSTQEIFGPVVCIYPYTDRMEAIQKANALPYAFQAAVFTKNIDVALDTVNRLNATAVMINDHTAFRVDWMPFGGKDASGIGLGGIPYSMKEMTKEKLMVIKSVVL